MSQSDRVLAALKRAGSHGITQIDFDPPTIDGGKPIKRVAARVYELRKAFHIAEVGRRNKCRVYVYVGAWGAQQETPSPVPKDDGVGQQASTDSTEPSLFDGYVDRDTSHWRAA